MDDEENEIVCQYLRHAHNHSICRKLEMLRRLDEEERIMARNTRLSKEEVIKAARTMRRTTPSSPSEPHTVSAPDDGTAWNAMQAQRTAASEKAHELKAGDRVEVIAQRAWDISIHNDIGGNETLPCGTYMVAITSTWVDHATGVRCTGVLLHESDVTIARIAGTTRGKPKKSDWNPAEVVFNGRDVCPQQ